MGIRDEEGNSMEMKPKETRRGDEQHEMKDLGTSTNVHSTRYYVSGFPSRYIPGIYYSHTDKYPDPLPDHE